jgi:glycerol-3-phosphate dehydrogenase
MAKPVLMRDRGRRCGWYTARMQIDTDIIIFGGGIAGLWLLNRLSSDGYRCLLLEKNELGGGQTLVSQGMVHGGLKYALAGALNSESETIAAMPDRWRACLAGDDTVDLSSTKVLSDVFYMWSGGSMLSRFTGFAASKSLRGRIDKLAKQDYPAVFQDKAFKGNVYKLFDPVLDTHSLLDTLLTPWQNCARQYAGNTRLNQEDGACSVVLDDGSEIKARMLISSAGKGSTDLLQQLGYTKPEMQLRPLHQVAVSSPGLPPLYAHALGHNPSPRVTISSHQRDDGSWVWFLGGDLATGGIEREENAQIDFARKELKELLPWVDLSTACWRTIRVDRAEPKQSSLIKPDDAFAEFASDNVLVTWPTKLTLAPRLGDIVANMLQEKGIRPESTATTNIALPAATIAAKPWQALFD